MHVLSFCLVTSLVAAHRVDVTEHTSAESQELATGLAWEEVVDTVLRRADLEQLEREVERSFPGRLAAAARVDVQADGQNWTLVEEARQSDAALAERQRLVHEPDSTPVGQSGKVRAIWTVGAPGTKIKPMKDARYAPEGCFPGLRFFTSHKINRTVTATERAQLAAAGTPIPADQTWSWHTEVDPVTYITAKLLVKFRHSMMDAMALSAQDEDHSILRCSFQTAQLPYTTLGLNISLHFTNTYLGMAMRASAWHLNYDHLKEYVTFMNTVYFNISTAREQAQELTGWKLVGKAESTDKADATHLYQDPKTLNCALVFRGSDDAGDWANNINLASTNFCGMTGVHQGFHSELMGLMNLWEFQSYIRPKLPKCRSVDLLGHSLGAGQAELFASCINSGFVGAERNQFNWTKAEPVALPLFNEITCDMRVKGSTLRHDPTGTATEVCKCFFGHFLVGEMNHCPKHDEHIRKFDPLLYNGCICSEFGLY